MKLWLKSSPIMLLAIAVGLSAFLAPAVAKADDNTVTFQRTDNPGNWFSNTAGPIAGTRSLAVATPGVEVRFVNDGTTNALHTVTSLIFPTGAAGMPFDSGTLGEEDARITLTTPGLYVFTCKIHPFMFAAVIVDDPATPGLDLGASITLVNGITVPTTSDLATRLLRTFFIATNPANWQDHSLTTWHITYPNVDVNIGGLVLNLPTVLNARYGNDLPMAKPFNPATPGVGEVWVDTEFELTRGKDKPGSATSVDTILWQPTRKVALPQIDMNNPHNMWTDQNQNVIYQTQWFDFRLTTFDRQSGRLLHDIEVGPDPSHVMTRTDTDHLHVALDGEDSPFAVVQLKPGGAVIERRINIEEGHPHAHWMGHDGKTMVTPNTFSDTSTIFDFTTDSVRALVSTTGHLPIATGMMPDDSKYYVDNFLDSTIDVINTQTGVVTKTINLLANYDPISGAITGPVGALPIQTPVSPDGKVMVTANILTDTITIVDTHTDTLVAMLLCDAGCHGVQWGAKKGGGYYAYVSSQFSNTFQVVDPDPTGTGDLTKAAVVGRILLKTLPGTATDDKIVANDGMGGQGVLPIPVVYNGWVQNLPAAFKALLTPAQQNPFPGH